MKWCNMAHVCMVYTECAETAAVSCGTRHVTTKQHSKHSTLMDIQKCSIKKEEASHVFRITCDMSAVSLLKTREQCYTKAISGKVNTCWSNSLKDGRLQPNRVGAVGQSVMAQPGLVSIFLTMGCFNFYTCVLVGCFTLCFSGLFYLVFWWVVLPRVLVGCFTCVLRNSYCQDLDSVLCVKS